MRGKSAITMQSPFDPEALVAAAEVLRSEPRVVRFQDVDAASTVFYPRFFEYASDVYVAHLDTAGIKLRSLLESRSLAIPLRRAESDFRHPLFFSDRFVTELVAARVGGTSFSLGFRIVSEDRARVHAVLQTVHVCLDLGTGRPTPVPDAIRRALSVAG